MGVSHVLSILDPTHPVPEAFGSFGEHAKLELRFFDVIEDVPDEPGPQPSDAQGLLAFGRDLLAEPRPERHLLVHCHAGISRSTAAMALILAQAMPEETAEAVIAGVHAIREKAWPNLRLMELGDAALNRGGALVRATHALHALQLERRPHLAELMTGAGRGREVEAAQALTAVPAAAVASAADPAI